MSEYSSDFYKNQSAGSLRSAQIILPIVFDIVKPKSMVDIGCGVGTWLSIGKRLGAKVTGYEGKWIDELHQKPEIEIVLHHLERPILETVRYDLASCLEVAEHLSPERAPSLVHDLCTMSDFVLFGAAVPGQGGTSHINEQWQSYWAALFAKNGYQPYDVVRSEVWNNPDVEWWYKQNMLLYVNKSASVKMNGFHPTDVTDIVHPHLYLKNPGIKISSRNLSDAIVGYVKRRMR